MAEQTSWPRKNLAGANVRRLRVRAGLSQDALAARLQALGWDLSRAGLSKIEAGLRRMVDAELVVLGRALDCAVAELLRDHNLQAALRVVRQGRAG